MKNKILYTEKYSLKRCNVNCVKLNKERERGELQET